MMKPDNVRSFKMLLENYMRDLHNPTGMGLCLGCMVNAYLNGLDCNIICNTAFALACLAPALQVWRIWLGITYSESCHLRSAVR